MRTIRMFLLFALAVAGCSEGSQDVQRSPGGMTADELRALETRAQIAKAELEAERQRLEELRRTFCPEGQEPVAVECRPVQRELPPPPAEEELGAIREKLSRTDVMDGMKAIAPAVQKCFMGWGDGSTVAVQLTIASNGRVSSSTTTGSWAGTPAGLCAARVVRGARFPQSRNSMSVIYPFKTSP